MCLVVEAGHHLLFAFGQLHFALLVDNAGEFADQSSVVGRGSGHAFEGGVSFYEVLGGGRIIVYRR